MGSSELFLQRLAARNYLFLLLIVGAAVALRLQFTSSLWIDETLTYWIIRDGFSQVIERALNYQGQSPFYFLLEWGWSQLVGSSELALRIPSLALVILTTLLVFQITKQLIDREAAALSCLLFIILDATAKSALSARPYALALFLATLSTELLLRWRRAPTLWHAAYYSAAMLATFYTHYLAAAIGVVHLFFVFCSRRELGRAHLRSAAPALTLSALLAIPGLMHLKEVSDRSALYSYPILPGVTDLLKAFAPPSLLIYLIAAILVARIFVPFSLSFGGISPISMKFLSFWYLYPPLLFFLYSYLSAGSLFLWRFYHWYTPALAILAAMLIRAITKREARIIAASIIALLTLIVPRSWQVEDWRQVAEIIRKEQKPLEPLLIYPGLIELNDLNWALAPAQRDYILAPFGYYPVDQSQVRILPSAFESKAAATYLSDVIKPTVASSESFLLVSPVMIQLAPTKSRTGTPASMLEQFKQFGFKATELTNGGTVRAYRLTPSIN